jgi:hypothetical protein
MPTHTSESILTRSVFGDRLRRWCMNRPVTMHPQRSMLVEAITVSATTEGTMTEGAMTEAARITEMTIVADS